MYYATNEQSFLTINFSIDIYYGKQDLSIYAVKIYITHCTLRQSLLQLHSLASHYQPILNTWDFSFDEILFKGSKRTFSRYQKYIIVRLDYDQDEFSCFPTYWNNFCWCSLCQHKSIYSVLIGTFRRSISPSIFNTKISNNIWLKASLEGRSFNF